MANQTTPMTDAERAVAYRARKKERPLLERLGYPELAERFAEDAKRVADRVASVQLEAETLNARMKGALDEMPESDQKIRAAAELTKGVRLSIKAF